MTTWKNLANKVYERERQELASTRIISKKMQIASNKSHQMLMATPNATSEQLQKIYRYTIKLSKRTDIIDPIALYNAYLPHLQKEIKQANQANTVNTLINHFTDYEHGTKHNKVPRI